MSRTERSTRALARVLGATLDGLGGRRVRVEADVAPLLPGFSLVGLAGASLRESRERIGRALHNAGFAWPEGRITVSLAPADLRKEGAAMDLPIAVAILLASGQICRAESELMRRTLFVGELALDGALRPARGAVAMALDARQLGVATVVVAAAQLEELQDVAAVRIEGLEHLRELGALLNRLQHPPARRIGQWRGGPHDPGPPDDADRALHALNEVKGQERARRALLVAAAGGHHLVLQGPPGCGKTMLARALAALLPPLHDAAALERRRILSCAGLPAPPPGPVDAPLRAPHHSTTAAGLLGGGRPLRPGEITLAHGGVLLLDEVAEFPLRVLDRLREPLSEGVVRLVRGDERREFPAALQLVATANPCPCGWYGSALDRCRCTVGAVARYRARLSGPLRDRIDLWVEMDREPAERYFEARPELQDADLLRRVRRVRRGGRARSRPALDQLDADSRAFVTTVANRDGTSVRGLASTLAVAETLAALEGAPAVGVEHLAEAFTFRPVQ